MTSCGQLGPREGVLVGAPGAAEHGDARRPAGGERVLDQRGGGARAPRSTTSATRPSPSRTSGLGRAASSLFDGLEAEPALVAQPAPVDGSESTPW